ncbi:hypothetical protein AAKU55_000133 [Oxalobacteraceae bacterium GrIS 1.11]
MTIFIDEMATDCKARGARQHANVALIGLHQERVARLTFSRMMLHFRLGWGDAAQAVEPAAHADTLPHSIGGVQDAAYRRGDEVSAIGGLSGLRCRHAPPGRRFVRDEWFEIPMHIGSLPSSPAG